jgi:hypothetical protein
MQELRSFQIIQAVSSVTEANPLCRILGVACQALIHQSLREASCSGGRHVIRSHESTSCQACLAKGHAISRWCMVSGSWSQSSHRGWCCRRWRSSLSAVQHLSLLASQWRNLTRGGAQVFQMIRQELQEVDPWNSYFFEKMQRLCVSFHCIERVCYKPPRRWITVMLHCSVHIPGGWQYNAKAIGSSFCPHCGLLVDL